MDDSHGPYAIYLKKVDNALTAAGRGMSWFKLQPNSVDSGVFCADRLRFANSPQPGVIPNIAPGAISSGRKYWPRTMPHQQTSWET